VGREAERVRITIEGKRGRRIAWLSSDEFRLFRSASALARALPEA
jgi:hypothetical protein